MKAIETFQLPSAAKVNYINAEYGLKSWLLTKDHKRIALLYLGSISFFFFIGGLYAMFIRLELLTPQGDLLSSATYNKVFTQHGIIMIFFFLIPSIPATLGNFLVPMMIGAKDLAFPRINLLSWYIYLLGGIITIYALLAGGVDTGWTFYAPYSTTFSNSYVIATGLGHFRQRLLVNSDWPELHRHDPYDAGPGHDLVSVATVYLVPLRHLAGHGPGDSGSRDHDFCCWLSSGWPSGNF